MSDFWKLNEIPEGECPEGAKGFSTCRDQWIISVMAASDTCIAILGLTEDLPEVGDGDNVYIVAHGLVTAAETAGMYAVAAKSELEAAMEVLNHAIKPTVKAAATAILF